jgi:predicted ATPase
MNLDHYLQSVSIDLNRNPPFDRFPFTVPAIAHLGVLKFHEHCTFLIGENGSGKSTVLEALALEFGLQPEGGSKNFRFRTKDTHSELFKYISVAKGVHRPNDLFFLRAETFYNVATEVDRLGAQEYYGGSLHARSHGESFYALLTQRMFGRGLYIMDEPEAALSPNRQLGLLTRMHDLIRTGSQFVIATHSPIVMAYPDAWIYEMTDRGPQRVEYEETEHYQVTRDFFAHRKTMLDELLKDE